MSTQKAYPAGMLQDRTALSSANCSVARTLEVIGERWTMLVLREAFYGVRRFDDFQRLTGAPRNILTARLRTLVEHDVLTRVPYREPGARQRYEYALTPRGRELLPAILALMQWGDEHLADPAGPPVVVKHRSCGEPVRAVLACDAGHSRLTARDTYPEEGPGAVRLASA